MESNGKLSEIPEKCPKCGMKLRLITGEFGKFIRCSGYPECNYSFNVQEEIQCPSCGKPIEVREGQYGKFLGCSGYPDCRFTINVIQAKKKLPIKNSRWILSKLHYQ
jgi:ssDNA-binding Zn-finger/Zn-ribbon topoisomerase 1